MTQLGTMQNGVIVPDDPEALPDGTRVAFEPTADESPSWAHETRQEILASLRQELADIRAGVPGISLTDFRAEMERDYGIPPRTES